MSFMERSKAKAKHRQCRKGLHKAQKPTRRDSSWVEASVWTERMVAALDNGVKGGKWFSLIDKVVPTGRPLEVAWQKVTRQRWRSGSGRPERRKRFAARAEMYLEELRVSDLEDGSYRPQPVKRVEIPKGRWQECDRWGYRRSKTASSRRR